MARGDIILGNGSDICLYDGKIVLGDAQRKIKINGVPYDAWIASQTPKKTRVVCHKKTFTYEEVSNYDVETETSRHETRLISEVDGGDLFVPANPIQDVVPNAIMQDIGYFKLDGSYEASSNPWEIEVKEVMTLDNFDFENYIRIYHSSPYGFSRIGSVSPVGFVGISDVYYTSGAVKMIPVVEYYSQYRIGRFIEGGTRGDDEVYARYEDTVYVAHVVWTFDFTRTNAYSLGGYKFWHYGQGVGAKADGTFDGRLSVKCVSRKPDTYTCATSLEGMVGVYKKHGNDYFCLDQNGDYNQETAQLVPCFIHGNGFARKVGGGYENPIPIAVPVHMGVGSPYIQYGFLYGKMKFPQITES